MTDSSDISQATKHRSNTRWLPFLVCLSLCVIFLGLWRMLDMQEQTNMLNEAKTETQSLAYDIEADLRNRIPTLQRMVRRWEIRHGTSKEEFISDARSYLSDVPGFQALEWVDKNFYVRWIVPFEGNERVLNLNLAFEKNRRLAMEKARDTRKPAVTLPINLIQGGKGFLTFFPVYVREEFEGYILATFRIQEWLDYVFSVKDQKGLSDNYRIAVFFDDIMIYKQDGWEDLRKNEFNMVSVSKIMDYNLYVHIRPTEKFIEDNKTLLPMLTGIFGILLSILISLIVYLFQKAYSEAQRANNAKTALELESQKRKKTDLELQHTLERIDLATKAGHMGVWTWDLSTDELAWNDRMFDLFDIPSDITPTYETWRNALHPDDLQDAETLLKNAVLGKARFDTEFRIILPDGAIRNIRAAARVERNHGGTPEYLTGLNWDITLNKQAEEALKKSEEKIRLLLNSTAEAIYGIDLQGNCTFANPSCIRMLGYADQEALLGKNMHNLIHHSYPDGRDMHVKDCKIYRAFHDNKNIHVEDEVLWKADGTSFPVEYWSYPQRIGNEICGTVVTFIDITERKKSELELANEKTILKGLLDSIPDVIFFKDLNGVYLGCNPEFEKYAGVNKDQIINKTDYDLFTKDISDSFTMNDKMIMDSGKARHNDEWVTYPDGEKIFLDTYKAPLKNSDGEVIGMLGVSRDMTDRKRITDLLTESEVFQRTLLDNISVGIFIVNPATRIIENVNLFATEIIGNTKEKIIGQKCHNFICSANENQCPVYDEGIEVDNSEKILLRADNTRIPILKSVKKIRIHGEEKLLESFVDITKQKEFAEKLKISEENFRIFFEVIDDLIFVGNLSGEVLHVNPAVMKKLGYTFEELKQIGILGVHPPEKQKEAEEIFASMFKKEIDYCPLPLQTKSGMKIPVETRVWFGKWNGQDCIFGISKDLTLIHATLEKFQKLFDNNPALMAISSISDRKFIQVNKEFLNILKYSRNEVIGKTADDLNLFVNLEQQKEVGQKMITDRESLHHLELKIKTKDNDILTGLFSGEIIDNQVEKVLLTVMTDITAQKRSEEEIRVQKEQLEKANAEKDKFFSIIAHDLRGPFTVFMGFTKILAEEAPSMTLGEIQDISLRMRESATNIFRLLENLLQWARIQQGAMQFVPKSVQFLPIVDEVMKTVLPIANNKNIEITYDIPENLEIYGDSNILQTLIRNLVSNAVKFTPRGGKIIILAKVTEGNSVEVAIKDSGIGMNSTMIDNIFRIDVKTNRKGTEGECSTGLGLIICKELIEKHGGKIWIESEEGKGSCFYFILPPQN